MDQDTNLYDDDQIVEGEFSETEQEDPAVSADLDGEKPLDEPISERRRFIRNTLIYGAGAIALGGGVAAIQYANRTKVPASAIVSQAASEDPITLPDELDINDLVELVNALYAENRQLTDERDSLRAEVDSANQAALELGEVNLLWARMDAVGLDGIVWSGIGILGGIFPGLLSLASSLATRLPFLRGVLERFLGELPGTKEGISWLDNQIQSFSAAIEDLKDKLKSVVQPVAGLADALVNFVFWLLDRLPFGAGDLAKQSLEAMRDIISNLGGHIEGVRAVILAPLKDWFGDDDEKSIGGAFFGPVASEVFDPAAEMADQVTTLETSYRLEFESPASDALSQRAAIREELGQKLAALRADGWVV